MGGTYKTTGSWLSFIPDSVAKVQEHVFCGLGQVIGRRPRICAASCLMFYLVLMAGIGTLKGNGSLFFLRMETDFLKTFTFTSAPEYKEYRKATEVFPDVHSISLIETPINSVSPLFSRTLRAAIDAESHITGSIKAEHNGIWYNYSQLCARPLSALPCRTLSAVNVLLAGSVQSIHHQLQELQAMEEAGASLLLRAKWLIIGIPIPLRSLLPVLVASSAHFPGALAGDTELGAWLAQATAISARFDLEDKPASKEFEDAVEQYLTKDANLHEARPGATIRITSLTTSSLGKECLKVGTNAAGLVLAVVAVMASYVVLMLGAETRVPGETQLLIMMFATGIPALSSLAAFGIMGYMGLSLNVLAVMAPFLGIATGIDGTFLIVTAVKSVGQHEVDPMEVMRVALVRAGPAITTTTTTSVASFLIAALTSLHFRGMSVFCCCQAVLLALNWFGMLVLLPSLITLNEHRITQHRWDLLPCLKRSSAAAMTHDDGDRAIPKKQSLIARMDLGGRGKSLVSSHLAPAVAKNTACQLIGSMIWISLVITGACLFPSLDKGMPDRYFITDSSPAMLYMDDLDEHFRSGYPIELGIVLPEPRLESRSYRAGLQQFIVSLSSNPAAITGQADCWPLSIASNLSDTTNAGEAQAAVNSFFESISNKRYAWDVHLAGRFSGSLETSIDAARCRLLLWQPPQPGPRSQQSKALRELAAHASIPAVVYHSSLPMQVSRFDQIRRELLHSTAFCACAVFVALIISLPVHLAMLAQINIMAVIIFLFGVMVITNTTCNVITYTICVMALGFCVDYSCHVVHFMEHGVPDKMAWNERVQHSLKECGFDVIQGCFTAFLGVSLLFFAGAEAFRMFAVLSMSITFFGGLFALWGLPAMIALVSSLMRRCSPRDIPETVEI